MYYDELVRLNRRLRKQLADANQRNRDLANENFELKGQITNLRLINPQGERLSSLLPKDTKAWLDLEWAIHAYVSACGGSPQPLIRQLKKRRARGAKKAR